jgi:hypothetical protein
VLSEGGAILGGIILGFECTSKIKYQHKVRTFLQKPVNECKHLVFLMPITGQFGTILETIICFNVRS